MKIVYLNPIGAVGGAERALLDAVAMVRAQNPSWELVLIAGGEGPLLEARARGVRGLVLRYPPRLASLGERQFDSGWPLQLPELVAALPAITDYSRALAKLLDELRPNLIHSNGLKMHMLAARAAPPRSALIWHLHDYVGARPVTRRLMRRYAPRCARIIANSNSVARDLRIALGDRAAVEVVHNGVDLDIFTPAGGRADLDALAQLPPAPRGCVRAGLIATAARWKGHCVFLDAIARLPPSLPLRAYLIGGPIYDTARGQFTLGELRAMIDARSLASRVGLLGFQPDIAAAMRALDIVVHASLEPEPFGLVIAEAMACGRAVITTALGGASELISAECDALSCAPRDPAALGAAIARLAENTELRQQLGCAAHATAVERFDRRRLGPRLTAIYEAALFAYARKDNAAPARP